MNKILIVSLAVVISLVGYTGLAQAEGFLGVKGRIKGVGWNGNLDGDVTVSTLLVTGTKLDFSNTLNLDKSTYVPEIELKLDLIKLVPFGLGYKTTSFKAKDKSSDSFEANLTMQGLYFCLSMGF